MVSENQSTFVMIMKEVSRHFARFLRTPARLVSGSFHSLTSTKSQSFENHEFREIHHHSQWCKVSLHTKPASVRARELLCQLFRQPGRKWDKYIDIGDGPDAIQTHTDPPAWLQRLPNTRRLFAVLYGRDDSSPKPSKRRKFLWVGKAETPGGRANSTQDLGSECDITSDRPFALQNMGKFHGHIRFLEAVNLNRSPESFISSGPQRVGSGHMDLRRSASPKSTIYEDEYRGVGGISF
jgi:hypothetical protein